MGFGNDRKYKDKEGNKNYSVFLVLMVSVSSHIYARKKVLTIMRKQ